MRERLRRVLVCAMLQAGVMAGVPMRPEQIQELLQALQRPKVVHVLPQEDERTDG